MRDSETLNGVEAERADLCLAAAAVAMQGLQQQQLQRHGELVDINMQEQRVHQQNHEHHAEASSYNSSHRYHGEKETQVVAAVRSRS